MRPTHMKPFMRVRRTNEQGEEQSECPPAYICRWDAACWLTSQEEGPPRQLVSALTSRTYVSMNMHLYLCVCSVVTSEGRRRCCQQVNPALRLSIKLSDQRINNSDGSLSGSITEHRLRGRQRHNKGSEVIYSLMQLTHILIKPDADSLRNCATIRTLRTAGRHTHARARVKLKIMQASIIFTHTQRATP